MLGQRRSLLRLSGRINKDPGHVGVALNSTSRWTGVVQWEGKYCICDRSLDCSIRSQTLPRCQHFGFQLERAISGQPEARQTSRIGARCHVILRILLHRLSRIGNIQRVLTSPGEERGSYAELQSRFAPGTYDMGTAVLMSRSTSFKITALHRRGEHILVVNWSRG